MPNAAHTGASASPPFDRGRLTFPRACRLLRRADYDRVYKEGRRRTSRHFTVFFRAATDGSVNTSRLGISVKRALGGAVIRNKIRRRIREIFRTHRQELPAGWDIVVHPRTPAIARADFPALATELVTLLRQSLT